MNTHRLIAPLAATAVITTTVSAATFTFIDSQHFIATGFNTGVQEFNPITAVYGATTDQNLSDSYLLDSPPEYAFLDAELHTTFSPTQVTASGFHEADVNPGPEHYSAGSVTLNLWFSVSETTAFTISGVSSITTQFNSECRVLLGEAGKPLDLDLEYRTPLAGPQDGSDVPFSFDGILRKDRTYLMQWTVGADQPHYASGSMTFQLTTAPIPEPETYAALAGLALAGFWVIRRRR